MVHYDKVLHSVQLVYHATENTVVYTSDMQRTMNAASNIQRLSCMLIGCVFYACHKYSEPTRRSHKLPNISSKLNYLNKQIEEIEFYRCTTFLIAFRTFQGMKIVGATCSSEGAEEYVFQDGVIDPSTNTIVYNCICKGRSSLFIGPHKMVCVIHYWICPVTS